MNNTRTVIGKILYSITFLILLPMGLYNWAKYTEDLVMFSVIESRTAGWILIIGGSFLMLLAMLYLIRFGKGLPMNAYPPRKFVSEGSYRFFRHPIYWGFGALMIGYFILSNSASGLWLVTPITILGIITLVLGYENIELKKRFPDKKIQTILDLPDNNTGPANSRDRLASLFWLLAVMLFANFITTQLVGNTSALFGSPLSIGSSLENHYLTLLSFVFVVSVPFLLKKKVVMREWAYSGILALSISVFIALIYPEIGAQYQQFKGLALLTVPIFLILISLKSIYKQSVRLAIYFGLVSVVLIVIQLINSPSAILHFTTSIVIFLLSASYLRIWIFLRRYTETIANSWKEWEFGKVRVINHGFYVGFGSFLGILLAGIMAGKDYAWAILVFAFIVVVFSALWAQIIEGSEKLKRPYGYYGALVGILFACPAVWAMGLSVWVVIGVISVVMPWVQAIGRFRCLINGCCHGRKVDDPLIGIRYFHHRSRVCGISGLKGELLHPTQLYAILWLFLMGFVLLALWVNNFSSSFIFGLYLILTGMGRFVEEAYRGEVQTPIVRGLRLYQWTAIASVIIGIFMTILHSNVEIRTPAFAWETLLAAMIGGVFTTFAMGIDFPYSNARFSRLV